MGMPDVVETVRDGEEKAREGRDEKEVVKDDEGREISVSAARLHTSSDVLEGKRLQPPPRPIAASHCGMHG